jgi:dTDP-4-amino-4,6-dideoxygalactose transaminase
MIRLTIPSIEEDDLQAVREVLASGFLVQGKKVAEFEQAVAAYVGTKHAIATSNCTTALHAALLALGVGVGDIVIVTSYSWIATANVIALCNAQPVFVDICRDTFNLDMNQLEAALVRLMANKATASRLKAILPVHTFGQPADMRALLELAARFQVPVIEDAACALGATLDGRQAGAWATMGCFSFHPRKAITTGEGGMITTDNDELARRLRAFRNHGLEPSSATGDFVMPGNNYRMTEFQAALGLTQMSKLDRIINARRQLAANYDHMLAVTSLKPPAQLPNGKSVYQSYVALLPEGMGERRAQLIKELSDEGIETQIGTIHMPLTTYFRTRYGYRPGDFPATDFVASHSLTLPLYEQLTLADQEQVVDALLKKVV